MRTEIAVHDADGVRVRGLDLATDVIGTWSYTELLYFSLCARRASPAETRILDACLVALMEAGLNPSTLTARMVSDCVPGQPQTAIAAGLLTVADVYAGSTGDCAKLLLLLDQEDHDGTGSADRLAASLVAQHRETRTPVPGFGHGTHRTDDPRAVALLDLDEEVGAAERHVRHLRTLGAALDASVGRHVPVNVTGAVAALLLGIGIPVAAVRGISVAARAGGLVGHVVEESRTHLARAFWDDVRSGVEYVEPGHDGGSG